MSRPKHTTGDVAKSIGETRQTIRRLIDAGLLKGKRWGRQFRIEADELKFYRTHGREGLERRAGK